MWLNTFLRKKPLPTRNKSRATSCISPPTQWWCDGRVLGKPADRNEAVAMLRRLSGNVHHVVTGVTVVTECRSVSFSVATEVSFARLTDEEINFYVDNFKPLDKAGAYGIQEWIGFVGVESISGSYFNVMGLPVQRLYQELKRL